MFARILPSGSDRWRRGLALALLVPLLAACDEAVEPQAEPIRPVRVVTVERQTGGETASLTGTLRAAEEAQLAFRTSGRIVELNVNLGDRVVQGQPIGRLEDETQRNAVQAARADLRAAMGELERTTVDFERQETLLERGFTTRVRYDQALQAMRVAQSWVDSAEAQLAIAEEQLAFTTLAADAPGVVTLRAVEPGEVVGAGQMVVSLARDGGIDAVFDVPERIMQSAPPNPAITVRLASDRSVEAPGRVREVAPQADPVTRTFEVRVGLADAPSAMRLGSTVIGAMPLDSGSGIALPAAALSSRDGAPAVFVVDPATGVVELRPVELASFDLAEVVVEHGLVEGEVVVTAGVQALRPGQVVRVTGAGS
ncbi:MAG: efflux RND transporter periplasmic adaptor subunit [Pseudomonadota bacterium]